MYPRPGVEIELLRVLAERQGVSPGDADLEAVRAFLETLLPALERLEERIPPELVPVS